MNASFLSTIQITSLVIFFYYTLACIAAIIKKRNDIADTAWGIGFVIASVCPLFLYGIHCSRSIITTMLVLTWGTRLSLHIFSRNKGKPEDYRYQEMRAQWKNYFYIRTYLQVFLLQGLLLLIIVSPVLFINTYQQPSLTLFDYLGLCTWIFGFIFEAVADYQLASFLKKPHNQSDILTSGLWKYSRHPNYFGEITQWWGIFFIALSLDRAFLTIIGPLTITLLITKVSGIPLLEKKMEHNTAFQQYKKYTSLLIPWPPRDQSFLDK
jgi:steroid 5-alpha reductase family enzyme